MSSFATLNNASFWWYVPGDPDAPTSMYTPYADEPVRLGGSSLGEYHNGDLGAIRLTHRLGRMKPLTLTETTAVKRQHRKDKRRGAPVLPPLTQDMIDAITRPVRDRGRRQTPPERVREALWLVTEGVPYREITSRTGMTPPTIVKYVRLAIDYAAATTALASGRARSE